ncbi:MAG: aspartate aminotransferase family protein [Flavobacteriales bacterium]
MNLFDVYPLTRITPIKAEGCYVFDETGKKYLDLYGGHAVISIGHSHPVYVKRLSDQLKKIGFYSNSVVIPAQEQLADLLGLSCGYANHRLFLCNSGAESIENAIKLASFHTGRKGIIAFNKAFHGRTSAAVAITDNPAIQSEANKGHQVTFVPLNDLKALKEAIQENVPAAIIFEGIQGVGGVHVPDTEFLNAVRKLCDEHHIILIADEIQSGYGRTGRFFAHQHAGIQADLITVAKGMGNGFPVAGVLIGPQFKASHGLLGTTFGGNHLACEAALAVLDVIHSENLIKNAELLGEYLITQLQTIPAIREVRGKGLMIGLEFDFSVAELRDHLLKKHQIFTGASGKNVIRLLPPLSLTKPMADSFIHALKASLNMLNENKQIENTANLKKNHANA